MLEYLPQTLVVSAVCRPVKRRGTGFVDAVEGDSLLHAVPQEVHLSSFGGLVHGKPHLVVGGLADGGGHVIRGDQAGLAVTSSFPPTAVLLSFQGGRGEVKRKGKGREFHTDAGPISFRSVFL